MDRNVLSKFCIAHRTKSPPARVAWIETKKELDSTDYKIVATREGGVDRNTVELMEVK